MLLEIACFSLEAAIIAEASGADRIELCAGPLEGGLTPSFSMISLARSNLKIPIHVMIRPREGDFLYTAREFKSMEYDIKMLKDCGIDGVVLGILCSDGSIDIERVSILVKAAAPMNITIHRAFDLTRDPFAALNDIISTGAARILTSGQKPTAFEGKKLIAKLVELSKGKISIMPGSGVNISNIVELCKFTSAMELHASARKLINRGMVYVNADVNLHAGSEFNDTSVLLPDSDQIRQMKNALTSTNKQN